MPGKHTRNGFQNVSTSQSHRKSPSKCSKTLTDREYYCLVFGASCLGCLLYLNTLSADFAYDDSRAIKANQDLLPSTPLSHLFTNDYWGTPLIHSGSHGSYRPLVVLTFRANYAAGGLDPWGYHALNVGLHAAVCALFTGLAARVARHASAVTTASLLFAVHPVHSEAVAGVVGRADLMAGLFALLSLLAYFRYTKYRDKPCLYGSLACACCAMLCKEYGITVLALCALYDYCIVSKQNLSNLTSLPWDKRSHGLREGLLHLGATGALLILFRIQIMGFRTPDFAPADNPAADSDSFFTRTLTFFFLPAFNLWLLLCPRVLSFDWSMEAIPLLTSLRDSRNVFSFIFYGGLLRTFLNIFRNNRSNEQSAFEYNSTPSPCLCQSFSHHSFSSSSWSHKHALPSSSFFSSRHRKCSPLNNNNNSAYVSFQNGTAGYKAMYANGSSAVKMASPSFDSSSSSSSDTSGACHLNHRESVMFSLALLVVPFLPATNLLFYVGFVVAERILYVPSMGFCLLVGIGAEMICRRLPPFWRRAILFCLLAVMSVRTLLRNVDWQTEENLYRAGIPVNPPKAYGNLANILSAQGKKEEAEWAYKRALSYRGNMADVHYNLGNLLQEEGRLEEALRSYQMAVQFRPRLAMAYLNMGLVLGTLGQKEEAIEAFRKCAGLDGNGLKDPKLHESTRISGLFHLGRIYAEENRHQEAIKVYLEAVQKMPEHYQPQSLYNMLGEAYFKMEHYAEAEFWYRKSLRAKPDHVPALLTYAKLLSKWDKPSEAEERFWTAQSLAPNDSSVYQHYGQFLSEQDRYSEAAEVYIRAAHLAPDHYEIIFNAANTLRQAGRNHEAERYYKMAVKLRPNEVTSHMNLGAMLHLNGKLLEAEASYLEALRLRPDDPTTRNNLQKLRHLLVHRGIRPRPSTAAPEHSQR